MKGLVDGIRYEERETDWIIFWISIRFPILNEAVKVSTGSHTGLHNG